MNGYRERRELLIDLNKYFYNYVYIYKFIHFQKKTLVVIVQGDYW